MSKRTLTITIMSVLLVTVLSIVLTVTLNKGSDTKGKETTTSVTEKSTSNSEKSNAKADFSKKSAVSTLTSMLNEFDKAPKDKMTLEERAKELNKDNYDKGKIFSDKAWNSIQLDDFMKTDPRGVKLTAQSILSVLNAIHSSTSSKTIAPAEVDYSGVVYLDSQAKIAYIPLDLYTGTSTNFSIELFYMDGEWKLQPYSLITQLAIKTTAANAIQESQGATSSTQGTDASSAVESAKKATSK